MLDVTLPLEGRACQEGDGADVSVGVGAPAAVPGARPPPPSVFAARQAGGFENGSTARLHLRTRYVSPGNIPNPCDFFIHLPIIAGSLREGRRLASGPWRLVASRGPARAAGVLPGRGKAARRDSVAISGPPGAGVSAGKGAAPAFGSTDARRRQAASLFSRSRSNIRHQSSLAPTASTERNHLTCAPMAE
jgi:hypothetical protein